MREDEKRTDELIDDVSSQTQQPSDEYDEKSIPISEENNASNDTNNTETESQDEQETDEANQDEPNKNNTDKQKPDFSSRMRMAGAWAKEHVPGALYTVFWGVVHFVGRIVRTIVFGDDRAPERVANEFAQWEKAQRHKEETKEQKTAEQKEAKEQAEKAKEEAKTAQESKATEEKEKNPDFQTDTEEQADSEKVVIDNQEQESLPKEAEEKVEELSGADEAQHEIPHKSITDILAQKGLTIVDDPELDKVGIVKLAYTTKSGEEKNCFIKKEALEQENESDIIKALDDAKDMASAQNYLNGLKKEKDLVILAVDDERFVLGRKGGAEFSYGREMMKANLSGAIKLFKIAEKEEDFHRENISSMNRAITTVTLPKIIKEIKEEQERNVPPKPVEKAQIHIDFGDFKPNIVIEESPYQHLIDSDYVIGKPDENGNCTVHRLGEKEGYKFPDELLTGIFKDPKIFDRTFRAMEQTDTPKGTAFERPTWLADVINRTQNENLKNMGLAMAADERGDSIYVFQIGDNQKVDSSKMWMLSQSDIAMGDATGLARILFEINCSNLLDEAREAADKGERIQGIVSQEVFASTEAIAIVSAIRSENKVFGQDDISAFSTIMRDNDSAIVTGTIELNEEGQQSVNIAYGDTSVSTPLNGDASLVRGAGFDMSDKIDDITDEYDNAQIADKYAMPQVDEFGLVELGKMMVAPDFDTDIMFDAEEEKQEEYLSEEMEPAEPVTDYPSMDDIDWDAEEEIWQ